MSALFVPMRYLFFVQMRYVTLCKKMKILRFLWDSKNVEKETENDQKSIESILGDRTLLFEGFVSTGILI